ncbi:unnamed protein product [Vitrella brassicaformis CCMP3155]|uniref:START domain-containing protein n=1 Tax=Vitrella brassicaformis (strain CCMP3155) TaxID=1169540 RepID=A0A0G4E8U6_VITBC|nr:unnamed protein product [Vitrella brassicaformis CCMP3155]|eukprot:CEL91626.1 unnamed protein product [Vitrella brassicaformis CCMP3155]
MWNELRQRDQIEVWAMASRWQAEIDRVRDYERSGLDGEARERLRRVQREVLINVSLPDAISCQTVEDGAVVRVDIEETAHSSPCHFLTSVCPNLAVCCAEPLPRPTTTMWRDNELTALLDQVYTQLQTHPLLTTTPMPSKSDKEYEQMVNRMLCISPQKPNRILTPPSLDATPTELPSTATHEVMMTDRSEVRHHDDVESEVRHHDDVESSEADDDDEEAEDEKEVDEGGAYDGQSRPETPPEITPHNVTPTNKADAKKAELDRLLGEWERLYESEKVTMAHDAWTKVVTATQDYLTIIGHIDSPEGDKTPPSPMDVRVLLERAAIDVNGHPLLQDDALRRFEMAMKEIQATDAILDTADSHTMGGGSSRYDLRWHVDKDNVVVMSAEGVIDVPLFHLLCLLYETDYYCRFFPFVSKVETIMEIDRMNRVMRHEFSFPWPLNKRESINYGFGTDALDDPRYEAVVVCSWSITHDDRHGLGIAVPDISPHRVPMKIDHFTWRLQPITQHKTRLQFVFKANPHIAHLPVSVQAYATRYITHSVYRNMTKCARRFKGSVWEKRMHERPDVYGYMQTRLEEYFSNKRGQGEMRPGGSRREGATTE